jgi:hypothetical protein
MVMQCYYRVKVGLCSVVRATQSHTSERLPSLPARGIKNVVVFLEVKAYMGTWYRLYIPLICYTAEGLLYEEPLVVRLYLEFIA